MGNWARACIVYGFTVDPVDTIICPDQLTEWGCDWYWESIRSRPHEEMAGSGIIYGVQVYDELTPEVWKKPLDERTNAVEQLRVRMQSLGFAVEDKCSIKVALCGDISHEYYQITRLNQTSD